MKIDLVYLWCDGNDPIWRAKRQEYLKEVDTASDTQSFCEGRIANNDDLLYSLRSVDMYAKWINHIYIITDNQCPEWLDTTNSRVTIVDQNTLFDKDQLPLYNSGAIELGIHKIKGLSEYYLYANDDMMFNRAVTPNFFFTRNGKVKCRFHIYFDCVDYLETYYQQISSVNKAISSDFGLNMRRWYPHHQIDAYKKSSVERCIEMYKVWSEETIRNRFRTPKDMQRHIFSLYLVATGEGVKIQTNDFSMKRRILKFIERKLNCRDGCDSQLFHLGYPEIEQCINRFKPALVCFNDNERAKDTDRLRLKMLYAKLYPNKSQYEK